MRLDAYEQGVIELGLTDAASAAQDAFERIDRSADVRSIRTAEGHLMATIVLCGRWLEEIDRAPAVITGGVELPDHLRREFGAAVVFSMAAAADWSDHYREDPAVLNKLLYGLERLKERAFPSWYQTSPSPEGESRSPIGPQKIS